MFVDFTQIPINQTLADQWDRTKNFDITQQIDHNKVRSQ
jgi:hypothetical protein